MVNETTDIRKTRKKEIRKLRGKYILFWFLAVLFKYYLPLTFLIFKFGIFKDNVGLMSKFESGFLIGFFVSLMATLKDLKNTFKNLENKGWYQAYKDIFLWGLIVIVLLVSKIFVDKLLWIFVSLLIGSLFALYFEPKKDEISYQINLRIKKNKEE